MAKKPKLTRSTRNAFVDLGFDPEEAECLKVQATLMSAVARLITARGLTQRAAAELFGITQPRIRDLVGGKIELFSIDTLVTMLSRATSLSPDSNLPPPHAALR